MAQKHKSSSKVKKQTKSSFNKIQIPSSLLWLLLGVTIGMLAYSIFIDKSKTIEIAKVRPKSSSTKISIAKKSKKTQQVKNFAAAKLKTMPQSNTKELDSTSYEFYKMLSNEQIEKKNRKINKKSISLDLKPEKTPLYSYLVQAGSFSKLNDAEELKVKLTLSGYTPKMKKVILNNKTWYRIQLGPFNSESLAKKQQILLGKQNFKGTLLVKNKSN